MTPSVKGNVYQMIVRPTLMCGLEMLALTKSQAEDVKVFIGSEQGGHD